MPFSHVFASGSLMMWPLLICSVLAIALIAERVVFWYKVNRRQKRFLREVLELYRREPAMVLVQTQAVH